ncbi:START domain-containing protein [Kordia periserrulae]|uniref:START domain-containing protein n=1 Tax=Kordia periserrulae TaxID=701523 RepID=A0A2T6BWY6_9FLAO|nr:START domain-containing protein [Kordia periserrulae]PTX60591.1 START domain-containing protein [Kordia periserrulae]
MKICIAIVSFLVFSSAFAQKDWKLKKDKDDIKIYVKSKKNSNLKLFKAEMTVQSSLDTVLNVILDGDSLKDWNYKALDSKLLNKSLDDEYLLWMALDLPWPVRNRDVVIACKLLRITDDIIKIEISSASNRYPENDDYLRITTFEGFWLLQQLDDGIKVTHQMYGDPGGNLPDWFVNSTLTRAPYHNFMALKERVE